MSERYTWEIRETKLGEAQVVVDNTKEDCWYGAAMSICEILNCKEERIKELVEENEQLRAQLLICQQSKCDDGRFQVWEVPPIPKGTRITFSTTERSDKNE